MIGQRVESAHRRGEIRLVAIDLGNLEVHFAIGVKVKPGERGGRDLIGVAPERCDGLAFRLAYGRTVDRCARCKWIGHARIAREKNVPRGVSVVSVYRRILKDVLRSASIVCLVLEVEEFDRAACCLSKAH